MILKENKELKEKLIKMNKTIKELKEVIQELKYQIIMAKSESMNQIQNLMDTIEKKDEQIRKLKGQSKGVNTSNTKAIVFITLDQRVRYPMTCRGDQTFAEIENQLYQQFPEFKETENFFTCNGIVIQRYKTIDENKIINGAIIVLCKNE